MIKVDRPSVIRPCTEGISIYITANQPSHVQKLLQNCLEEPEQK